MHSRLYQVITDATYLRVIRRFIFTFLDHRSICACRPCDPDRVDQALITMSDEQGPYLLQGETSYAIFGEKPSISFHLTVVPSVAREISAALSPYLCTKCGLDVKMQFKAHSTLVSVTYKLDQTTVNCEVPTRVKTPYDYLMDALCEPCFFKAIAHQTLGSAKIELAKTGTSVWPCPHKSVWLEWCGQYYVWNPITEQVATLQDKPISQLWCNKCCWLVLYSQKVWDEPLFSLMAQSYHQQIKRHHNMVRQIASNAATFIMGQHSRKRKRDA